MDFVCFKALSICVCVDVWRGFVFYFFICFGIFFDN